MSAISVIQGLIKGSNGIIGVTQRTQVILTSAQILALNSTPVQLVAAPGAGKAISIDEIIVTGPASGATAYTGANAVEIRYTNGSGLKVTGDYAAASLNSVTGQKDRLSGVALANLTQNAAVVASVPTANPAAGTGTVTFDVIYRSV